MDEKIRAELHDFTLEARALLFTEASQLLEGVYGLLPNGRFELAERYRALTEMAESAETRRRLELYFLEEGEADHKPREIREKLVKEIAFTWLNRLVAFKMMEARKLIRQTVSKGAESNGFKLWLTEEGNETDLEDYERGDLPQDALGEGPRQRAYRRFLLDQCRRLAEEIKVLFDPDNLASRLCPRPKALTELIEQLNAENLIEAWEAGNEETIGWIYQYFNEPDLEIFRGQSALKVPRELVGPRTQQYTPSWVVKFLVENSLGRLWCEIHPDSDLPERLTYLLSSQTATACKILKASDIRILDPACGTMHFGLVAFDLLVEMYREEIRKAGLPGWPLQPSVQSDEEIPRAILIYNIHGIDLDLRSVQLAVLALYLKAKVLSPNERILGTRLVCAEIDLENAERVQSFLDSVGLGQQPLYIRLLEAAIAELKDSRDLGSLIRPEQRLDSIIEQEWLEFQASRQQLFFGDDEDRFGVDASSDDFWQSLKSNLELAIDKLAEQDPSVQQKQSFFARETEKGLRLLELLKKRYTIVMANPPYLDSRDQNARLKQLLTKYYPKSKRNLYSAFIERSLELVEPDGRLAILTGQTFMFISTFEAFRKSCLVHHRIEHLIHFDYGLFQARVDTAAFILRRENRNQELETATGTYFRLVKEPDADAKQKRFEEALQCFRRGENDPIVFRCHPRKSVGVLDYTGAPKTF